jgi:hypothetical protein
MLTKRVIASLAAVYLAFAFIFGNINSQQWSEAGRFACVVMFCAAFVIILILDDDSSKR